MKKIITFVFFFILVYNTGISQTQLDSRLLLKQKLALAKEDTSRVNLFSDLVWTYMFTYEDTAMMYANKALELSKKIGYKKGEAQSLMQISLALTLLGNFTSGLNYGFEGLAKCEAMQDSTMLAFAYNNLSVCYREQEDYKAALEYVYKALKFSNTLMVDSLAKSMALGYLSSVYERTNQLDSALYYGHKANDFTKKWSGLYMVLGNIYLKLKKRDAAFNYYKEGIRLAEEQLIYIDLVDIYNKMSIEYEMAGNTDSSIYYAQKSINIEGVASYPEGELRTSRQLAHLYEKQGIKDSTIKYLKLSEFLGNSLMNRQKTREAQSLAFNDQLVKQKLSTLQQENQNKIKMYVLLLLVLGSLSIAFILWRNNRHKQKANNLLHRQKEEINLQRDKAEKAYSELKTTQAQLIQSEKMASLGELTAGIAHEIQNPLNFVNNFSEVNKELLAEMKEEIEKGNYEEVKALAKDVEDNEEKINHHGKRADAIVKGMLQHSQTSTGVKEPTDINKLADEYLRLAYHGLRAKDKSFNATMKTDYDESIGNISIIPQDIGRVLLNLYNNAFYSVTEKKKQADESYEPTVTVSTKRIGNKVLIAVKDNGNGIPQKVVDKIFQPFFTTKPTGQGTGLGLSLSYDIVKAHGGELKVETKEGEGSEFIIVLLRTNNS